MNEIMEGKIKYVAEKVPIGERWARDILVKGKTPSRKVAARLEEITGIDRRAWMWPEEFPNDYIQRKAAATKKP